MKVDVTTEIVIDRPRSKVAKFAANPANAPRWYANIESVEWKSTHRVAAGSRIAFVASFLGKRISYTYEIVELVPLERLVMRTAEGPFPMETTYTWEALSPRSTRMTLRNRGTPAGFAKFAGPMMGRSIRKATEKDLTALKELLEST
ncbi:MAG TPA: SRPBCC family protein [Gemmatimonadaceae bacterium]|nr:SRPBCC family protein [Gemmatimonadaceae bacterium]